MIKKTHALLVGTLLSGMAGADTGIAEVNCGEGSRTTTTTDSKGRVTVQCTSRGRDGQNGASVVGASVSGNSVVGVSVSGAPGNNGVVVVQGGGETLIGNGELAQRSLALEDFRVIDLRGSAKVSIEVARENRLIIEGDSNIIAAYTPTVHDGSLSLGAPPATLSKLPLRITILSAHAREIDNAGAGKLSVLGDFAKGLSIRLSGAGALDFDVTTPHLSLEQTSTGTIEGSGSTARLNLSATGAGNINLRGLRAARVEVTAAGAGTLRLCATEAIAGTLSGAVQARVYCGPTKKNLKTEGVAAVDYVPATP